MTDILTRFGVTYAEVPSPQTLTEGDGDSLANDLVLQDETNTLVLEVTAEQYTKLLSAALDGANRHWPESYIEVIYPLIKAAKVSDALCEAIAACIENPESDTYAALHDFLLSQIQNNAEISDAISGIGNTDGTLVTGATSALSEDCDLDNLFGFCRQVVQFMNIEVEQFFQVLEVITNDVEFAAYLGDKAPALGTVATFISYLQNTLVESYLANYDVDYENDLACELFCFARSQPSCALNWFNITDLLGQRVSEDINNLSLSDLLTYVLSGGWAGDEFCDVSLLVFAFLMQIGADWAGISFPKIQVIVQTFLNDPDSDWSTLCPCGWSFTENFPETFGVFELVTFPAGWSPSTVGATGEDSGLIDTTIVYTPLDRRFEGLAIEANIATPTNFTRIRFNYEALVDNPPNSSVRVYNGASLEYEHLFVISNTGDNPKTIDLAMDVTGDKIEIRVYDGFEVGGNPGGSLYLPFVTVQGDGTIPPEWT